MVKYEATQEELDTIKAEILKGKKLNDYGDYECGCSLNPRYALINKMCNKHQRMIKEID